MSDRSSRPGSGLVVFALLVTAMSWPLPGALAATESVMISPVAAEFGTADISISRPAIRRSAASKAFSQGALNILQADASGALTVLVESVGLTGDTPTADDNDFTRIDNAVQAVAVLGDGTRVRLIGIFDWAEENALASWVASDYTILAPVGVADVTIHAPVLGDAVIVGPGELDDPAVYYEAFLSMWGGLYQGWTVENLVIRGFDWAIGMFYAPGDGSTEDFNGVTIRNNRIEMHEDLPGNFDDDFSTLEGEPWQNIALHLAFGENQTISGNEIVVPGSCEGIPYGPDPDNPQKCSSVVLQSNTSGGDAFDGLRIVDNLIRVTGAQTEIPEIIYGIWENAAGHSSNVEVSGNAFFNEHPGNDPALNFQRALRVTSHSSATTTVEYSENIVEGANIAIHWIGDNYSSRPPSTVSPVIVEGNTLLGNGTGVWVHTDDDGLDPAAMSKAVVRFNRFVGNGVGVRSDDAEVTAVNNWWGCNGGPGANGCDDALYTGIDGFLDADPWLVLALDLGDQVMELGADTAALASVRTNSDDVDLGEIGFPATEIGFSAVRGTVISPVETIGGAAGSTFTAAATGIGSVTAALDNQLVTASVLIVDDGVVRVRSVMETGDTPTLADNDYTRINDLVQMVGNGVTVELEGFFDWTESFAAIAWGLGSDGEAGTEDDYAISAPAGLEDVTIGAAYLGDATIQGPGDLPTLDWETFLGMWQGTYFGWTVENLVIQGFDWSIGMFFTTGSDFDGVTIRDNQIEMPTDEPGNYSSDIGEPWQNVAIHLAGGTDQTVEGNLIIIPGDALADTGNPELPLTAASVALQSNTHGGTNYDGLRIIDNRVLVVGAQSVDPEWVFGIWENGHAHASDIEVSGNVFANTNTANDPALNLQRALRVTSHSSAETTVTYADNFVQGANIGLHWIGDNYTSTPPASVLPVVVERNTLIDNQTAVWVHTDGLGESATSVELAPTSAAFRFARGVDNAVTPSAAADVAPGGTTAAKTSGPSSMSKADLRFNRIAGNAVGLRVDDAEVQAENNWWGCNAGPNNNGCDSALSSGAYGLLDFDPWLVLGLSVVPDTVQTGGEATATATLDFNSNGDDVSALGSVADDTPVGFAATGGVMAPISGSTLSAVAASTYTAGPVVGGYHVSATVDSETVSRGVTVVAWADIAVTVDPERQYRDDGEVAIVTVTVTNNGPLAAMGSSVTVDFPAQFAGVVWTCAGSAGGTCAAAGGGDIDDTVGLPAGASVLYTAEGTVPDPFAGGFVVSASATPPVGITDPDLDNNSAEARILALRSIFADGFESGDPSAWAFTVGLAP